MTDPAGIERGHVLWASDPFKSDADAGRPLIVLSDDTIRSTGNSGSLSASR